MNRQGNSKETNASTCFSGLRAPICKSKPSISELATLGALAAGTRTRLLRKWGKAVRNLSQVKRGWPSLGQKGWLFSTRLPQICNYVGLFMVWLVWSGAIGHGLAFRWFQYGEPELQCPLPGIQHLQASSVRKDLCPWIARETRVRG